MSCARTLNLLRPARTTNAAVYISSRGLRTRAKTGVPAPKAEDGDGTATGTDVARMRTLERMPFQTFQLALDVIKKDRDEKLVQIKKVREKLENARKAEKENPDTPKDRKIRSMEQYLEYLKVQADINNPRVKYNFDRGISSFCPAPTREELGS